MSENLLGQVCALLTAVVWAFAVVLFKTSGEKIPPLALNIFKNTVGMVCLVVTLLCLGDGFSSLWELPPDDVVILAISGVIGIALADTFFLHGLNLVGVGIISIVECLYSPSVLLASYLFLGEKLAAIHYIGGALVLTSILLSTGHAPPMNRTRRQVTLGVAFGSLSMAMMAVGIVLFKPIVAEQHFPLIWAVLIRMFFSTAVLACFATISRKRRLYWSVFRPSRTWWMSVTGSFLGAYVSMVLWMAGFVYAQTAIVAILNQTSVIFGLILATVLLKEVFTKRKFVAVTLAVTGVLIIVLWPTRNESFSSSTSSAAIKTTDSVFNCPDSEALYATRASASADDATIGLVSQSVQ